MTTLRSTRNRVPVNGLTVLVAALIMLGLALSGCSSSSASSSSSLTSGSSELEVGNTAQGWTFTSGHPVTVSMPANKIFTPHIRVNILECADAGGTPSHLPTSQASCDANTIESDSVIPNSDGSFTEPAYTVYSLPNRVLGEEKTWLPICNQTHQCVLYIGQDQGDFTKPKIFSHPFTVSGS